MRHLSAAAAFDHTVDRSTAGPLPRVGHPPAATPCVDAPSDDAGCGCAYPARVDAAVVERSNRIHQTLKATAHRHAGLRRRLSQLPMLTRDRVAACRVGVVHGDADALAGWGFDVQALDDPRAAPGLRASFETADVDLFASTHTCLPAMREFGTAAGRPGWVVNNGAAGMPNFAGDPASLITRIATTPSPWPVLHEVQAAGAFAALLPVHFASRRWQAEFLAQWPPGSPAWTSYFDRISRGPDFAPAQALPRPRSRRAACRQRCTASTPTGTR